MRLWNKTTWPLTRARDERIRKTSEYGCLERKCPGWTEVGGERWPRLSRSGGDGTNDSRHAAIIPVTANRSIAMPLNAARLVRRRAKD